MPGSGVRTVGAVLLAALIGLSLATPAASGALERGQAAFRRGDWAEAERNFWAAARGKPKIATALKWLGVVYVSEEKPDRANVPSRTAIEAAARGEVACYS